MGGNGYAHDRATESTDSRQFEAIAAQFVLGSIVHFPQGGDGPGYVRCPLDDRGLNRFLHTLIGVDHALPFVALGKARGWNLAQTLFTTFVCGVGHVLGSVLIGAIGIGLGVALETLEFIEGFRGEVTAWLIIGFGLAYATWSMLQLKRKSTAHSHTHTHADGTVHAHHHEHAAEHAHVHRETSQPVTKWPYSSFFVFGPCEAPIPVLMAPAAEHNWLWVST